MGLYPTQRIRAAYVEKSETVEAEVVTPETVHVDTVAVEAITPETVHVDTVEVATSDTVHTETVEVESIAPIAAAATAAAITTMTIETTNSEPVTTSITHIAPEAPSTSTVIDAPADVEDDYLPCREYEGRNINDKVNNVALFKHDNGQYYFAIYNADGSVRLRSEGFRTAQERDVELSGVMKNLNNPDMYSIIRRGDYFINVLKDKTGREVGRSCLQKDVPPPPPPPPAPVVEAIAPVAAIAAAAAVVAPSVIAPADVEDDYLPCKDYEGHNINDKVNNVALFKHENGQYYFALYDADGKVRLRSEGFRTAQDRDKELSGALKNLYNQDMYSTIRRGEYYISILKDKTGREVGRSCLQKDEPKPVVAPVVAAPLAAAAIAVAAAIPEVKVETPKVEVPVMKKVVETYVAPPVYEAAAPVVEEVAAKGFNWWWLLIPLLGLLAWWFTKDGCNKPAVSTPTVTTAPVPPVVVDTVKSVTPAPAVAATESCDLNWIFFDFNKADLRSASQTELDQMAAILKKNPDYVAVLSAHTDSKGSDAYNDALSGRRATNAKQYLISKGIGAARIKTTMSGEKDAIAQNTEDDRGRQYNRRVELYVQDKNGKNVCESIPPAVSSDLKVK
jgi:outer membrane protein OmpA-like peptidoglycan-associated protein/uncharacterized protein YegP (UPF0339 family)